VKRTSLWVGCALAWAGCLAGELPGRPVNPSGPNVGSSIPSDGGQADAGFEGDGGSGDGGLETSQAGLSSFVAAGDWRAYIAEPAAHDSAGPHGQLRVFVDERLYSSLKAFALTHPLGSVAVAERYDLDGGSAGHLLTIKDTGAVGAEWVFFEQSAVGETYERGTAGGCGLCHAAGTDFVFTPGSALP
jgi:hypothetical protein